MAIQDRNLAAGTKLIATYKKETYHALVVAGADGNVRYTLAPNDGKEYKSPSSLGTAVTQKSCNGWTFWSVDTGEAQETETAAPAETEAPTSEPEEPEEPTYVPLEEEPGEVPVATFRRGPNQRGVDEGQVRLYCDTCRNSFIVPDDKTPETCPMGHRPGVSSIHEESES